MLSKRWSLKTSARYFPLDADRFLFLHMEKHDIIARPGCGRVIAELLNDPDRSSSASTVSQPENLEWLAEQGILRILPELPSVKRPHRQYKKREAGRNGDIAVDGIPAQGGLTLIPIADYLDPRLGEVARTLEQSAQPWAPARWEDSQAWAGPVFAPNARGCWDCLAACLRENRWIGAQVGEAPWTGSMDPIRPEIRDWLISAIARLLDHGMQQTFARRCPDGGIEFHFIRARAGCSRCAGLGAAHPEASSPVPSAVSQPSVHLAPLVSGLSGIIRDLTKQTGRRAMHCYKARHIYPVTPLEFAPEGGLIQPGKCSSRGWTEDDAYLRCLTEAVEHYSTGIRGDEQRVVGSITSLGGAAISPDSILNFSPAQVRGRHEWNTSTKEIRWQIPEPLGSEEEIEWVTARPVWTGEPMFVPAALCFMNYRPRAGKWIGDADSTGCAAGNSIEEAILGALLELVERDAVAIAWYNGAAISEISLESIDDVRLAVVRDELGDEGWTTRVFDCGTGLGAHVYFCLSRHPRMGWLWSAGAHPDAFRAFSAALTEMWQLTHGPGRSDGAVDITPRLGTASAPKPGEIPTLHECMDQLRKAFAVEGLNAHWIDLTRPDIEFPVVRAVAPGLRHTKPRFGPGRLYEVPKRLGWLSAEKTEAQLAQVFL